MAEAYVMWPEPAPGQPEPPAELAEALRRGWWGGESLAMWAWYDLMEEVGVTLVHDGAEIGPIEEMRARKRELWPMKGDIR